MVHSMENLGCDVTQLTEDERVHRETYHAHALPGANQRGNTNHEENCRQGPPATAGTAQCDQNGSDGTSDYTPNTEPTRKDHPRTISIANSPADEVGMSLMAETPFHCVEDAPEGRGMGGGS